MSETKPLRILFVKRGLAWPRQSGHDVHGFNMMRALARQGHAIGIATFTPLADGALQDLVPEWHGVVDVYPSATDDTPFGGLQERFRSYWGADRARIAAVGRVAREFRADVVVAAGMDVLPYYPALGEFVRVWYTGDDLVRQYLTWVRPAQPSTWVHLKQALIMLAYERAFAPVVDRVWAVSATEARAFQRYGGFRAVDVLPNGVDANYFTPVEVDTLPESAVFWGRLDFEPNMQAVTWFTERVWKAVRAVRPAARLTLIGFNPLPAIRALDGRDGIEVLADLPDLRTEVCRRAVVVLPFLAGGGIKNKLLEAAALARPIVCSRHGAEGLVDAATAPLQIVDAPGAWVKTIVDLWDDGERRRSLGARAREWAMNEHSWDTVARRAAAVLAERE